jgi:hypothetical protein
MNALPAASATVIQRRRSTAGTVSTGVTLVAMASPSSTPPRTVGRVRPPAVASSISAAAVMATATTSTCALLPASRATVGHQDHSAAIRTSRPSRPRPNSSSTVVSTATSAVAAWMGVVESLPAGR